MTLRQRSDAMLARGSREATCLPDRVAPIIESVRSTMPGRRAPGEFGRVRWFGQVGMKPAA